jgi:hypothetical protein
MGKQGLAIEGLRAARLEGLDRTRPRDRIGKNRLRGFLAPRDEQMKMREGVILLHSLCE